jgi:CubicO group peptidase (beta-lactamase class C family)
VTPQPLAAVTQWPVPTAAAAVVDAQGIRDSVGPLQHEFWLASVTKPLAALAMLVAVEEGAVELTDPADETLLPGATLRHLLAHASGVAPERAMRSFPPSTRRVYSNVGIEMAGALVEAAAEMPFASYFDEAFVRPLALTSTSLQGSPARDGRSTVADLAEVMRRVLSPDGFLHESTLADATTIQYPGLRGVLPGFGMQDPNDWGLGFEIRGMKQPHWTGAANSAATFGHFGLSGTMMWIDPVAGVGLIALADREFGDWARHAWPLLADDVLRSL